MNQMFRMKKLLRLSAFLLAFVALNQANAQIKVGDNPTNINANAAIEVESTSKGILLPRMNTLQQNAMTSPPDGMMIYNTDSACITIRRNGVWRSTCAANGGEAWSTRGNAGTNPSLNFLGTTDAQPLIISTNNAERARFSAAGFLGLGTTSPSYRLDIDAATGGAGNPLRLQGLVAGAISDSILTSASGVVRRMRFSDLLTASNNSWLIDGNTLTTAGAIGTNSNHDLHVETNGTTRLTFTNAGAITQVGTGQVTFTGNIDATNGLDVTNAALTATAGATLTGATTINSTGSAATTIGNAASTVNIAGNNLNVTGLSGGASTDSIMSVTAAGVVRRIKISDLGSYSFTADNGLTKTNNNVALGGALTSATTITTTSANTLSLAGLQGGANTDSIMTITSAGVIRRMKMADIGANSITASNGLTKTGNDIKLGGTLTETTTIAQGTNEVHFTGAGNLGMGTNAPTQRLHVVGNVYVTGAFITPSDIRLKTDITPLGYGLNEILKLSTISYHWKDQVKMGKDRRIGFVAQEIQAAMPELVRVNDDAQKSLSVSYSEFAPVLVNAIKEMNNEISALRSKIESLEMNNRELRAELNSSEANQQGRADKK